MENDQKQEKKTSLFGRIAPYLIGVGIIVLIVVIGVIAAYQSGLNARLASEAEKIEEAASEQFQLGLLDLEEGRCNLAVQRFEYIINDIDHQYPGVVEQLSAALLCTNATATATPFFTPTPTPSPTLTPTPDLRAVDDIYNDAINQLESENYDEVISLLDLLRGEFADYKPVDIDGLYYQAYRERGEYKILIMGELEAGIFDLNRAEYFGPIDAYGENYRNWATWYLLGLSFWDLNWDEVYYYFDLLVSTAPNLAMREEFGDEVYFITATERLEEAKIEYAPVLKERAYALWSQKEFCAAYDAIRLSNEFVPFEEQEDIQALGQLWGKCEDEKKEK